jgi:ATP-dependent RNA helicase DeaD
MTEEERQTKSFAELGLSAELLRAVDDLGYEAPTPIQEATIGLLLEGKDVIGQAQTGTGKTAAYAFPMIERLDPELTDDRGRPKVQGLVLAPTRELAVQVAEAVHQLGRHKHASVVPIYGGQPIDRQLRVLRAGVQIVVGTPGRVMDHMRRGTLDLSAVRVLVLDEADEMLDMGFVEDIEWILEEIPTERQTALFSATMPPRIRALSKKYMRDPELVQISSPGKITVPQIEQLYVEVGRGSKLDALSRILDHEDPESAMIFARTKRDVDALGEHLMARGYPVDTLHGDMTQPQRDRVMKRFREGNVELLVATDVAARGLDVENVSHVFNYELPDDPEQYVHRIGRTGRAGRKGVAISFVTPRERRLFSIIERVVGMRIKPMRLPTVADIQARRVEMLKEQVREMIKGGQLDGYLDMVSDLQDEFDPGELAAGFAKIAAEATQPRSLVGVTDVAAETSRTEDGMARISVQAGRRDGIRPGDLVGAIANETGLPGKAIGAIDIFDDHSFVEVPADRRDEIIRVLSNTTIKGNRVRVDPVEGGVAGPRPTREPPVRRSREPEWGEVRPQHDERPIREDRPPRDDRPLGETRGRRPPPSWERDDRDGRRPVRRRDDGPPVRREAASERRPVAGRSMPPWLKRDR